MNVLIVGAHGQVGQHLVSRLGKSDHAGKHSVRAMVRDEAQVSELEALGAEAVVADLTGDVTGAVRGCDAVIFAAGSGGSDVAGIDRDGAIKMIGAAEAQGVKRFVMLSSLGADSPEHGPDALRPYLEAKGQADERLQASRLDYTIVRPGRLTNDAATGKVRVAEHLSTSEEGDTDSVAREDVAAVLALVLELPNTCTLTFELLGGDEPIAAALKTLG